ALREGPPLADLPGRDSDPLVVRAERLHEEAVRNRLAADVYGGRPRQALPGLAALAEAAPLDESLQALRVRALRAAGRPAEALQAYHDIRDRLAERLGTDPGPELRSLYAELLAVADGIPEPPAAAPRRPAPGNLGAPLTSFVGRAAELAALSADLGTERLISLVGPGGAGKTRLSLEAARAVAGTWPDGVWVAELAPVRDEATVPEAVLTALGAREAKLLGPAAGEAGSRDPLVQLAEHCGQRRMLILLDNCEHVIGSAARLAESLLTHCPGVSVLASSREPLGVPGESVRTVEPLPQDVALRLFGARGAAARPGFRTSDDPGACAEICRRLDGLPLALELAAARLRVLTPRQIADRLDDRFRLLGAGSGSRTVRPGQRTLRAVVDWSWDLLSGAERAVLRRLSVFSGGCALAQAEAVAAEDGADGSDTKPDVLELLASLVDKSLVVAAPDDEDGMRYRLLETVREYAAGRLDESGERAAVERRHLIAYRELVRVGEPGLRGPHQARLLVRFEREHANVRAALRTAVDNGKEQEALCIALSMSWFWQLSDHRGDAQFWSAAVAALGPDPFSPSAPLAVPLPEPCTALPLPWSEEQLWEARRGVGLMVLAGSEGEGSGLDGIRTGHQLNAIVRAYRPGLPQNCRQPGSMWYFARLMTGEFSGLGETLEALVAACREQADHWNLGLALMLRSRLLGESPDGLERSGLDADEATALFERAGDLQALSESLAARAETHQRRGRYAEAAADLERAVECCELSGTRSQVPLFRARLASVRLEAATDDGDTAAEARAERALVEAAEEAAERPGQGVGRARLLLAQRYGRTGRIQAARAQLDVLEQDAVDAEHPLFGGLVAGAHAWLCCLEGEFGQALELSRAAVGRLDALAYLVAPHLIVQQFLCGAWAKAELGTAEDGARLLGAYARHVRLPGGLGPGGFPSAADAEIAGRATAAVRAALDGPGYERAYAEGGGLTVKEAAALL
ncbi:hypothetical protein QR77_01965, partial [Streptomyces sp. 150FB]|uniref:ATP-binding protein n=1 Tax=Streptomyces sp. 150FB TaxID=1576605 RepID=UPI00058937FA